MGLDYTNGCVNFRDVGGYINLITNTNQFVKGKLFRGGSIDYVKNHNEIQNAKTIINLRNSIDDVLFQAEYCHFPMSNKIEKYDTSQKEVQIWLNQIIKIFEDPELKFPVFVHCLSGKDRTGIVIAAILSIIGVKKEIIIEEYLLSEGEVQEKWIEQALNGMQDLNAYFNRVNLVEVRRNLKELL